MKHLVPRSLRVAFLLSYSSVAHANLGVVLLTVFILALAGLNMLFVPGLLNGLVVSSDTKVKDTYAGDIVVESATQNPLIVSAADLVKRIESLDGVVAATTRNAIGAELTSNNDRANCMVTGIVPGLEERVFTTNQYLIEGSFLVDGDTGIVLGVQLAGADKTDIELFSRSLKTVHAGDTVTVSYANGVVKSYQVKGIFQTEFIQTDLQAFISESEFDAVSPAAKGNAGSIRIRIAGEEGISTVEEAIKSLRSGLRVSPWQDYAGIMRSMTDSFSVINAILDVVNILVAGTTVFIVTYIDVTNKRKQIGIQRAIGITGAAVLQAYLIRAIFYAVVAMVVAGLIFWYVIMPIEARYPFRFPFGPVYLSIGSPEMARAFVILLAASLVAGSVPVWMSLRIRLLDAIWG